MSRYIRTTSRRVRRTLGGAGRRYVELMGSYDPNGYGYYPY